MLSKLILTILLTTQLFLPANNDQGQVLGTQAQEAGDKVITEGPKRIVNKNLGVKISASHAIVIDKESGKVLFAKNPHQQKPIASITKLMTVLVFLDTQPDFKKEIKIIPEDLTGMGKINLLLGERVTLENLFYLSLVNSDNNATLAMVRSTGMSKDEFVSKMNKKAAELHLSHTRFADPVGLKKGNVSTPYEVSQLLSIALENNLIKKALFTKVYSFSSLSKKHHLVKNTNHFLFNPLLKWWNNQGGKTGYTDEAGYCFTGLFKLKNGHKVISVVLNSSQANARFQDTKAIINWVEENYQWQNDQ